jgi:hypothetical protein
MCTSLKKINLKKNLIEKEENIIFLGNLLELTWLNLIDNPIRENKNYHNLVKEILPQLADLDLDEKIIEEDSISDKKFFESHSTFSSSPGSSTNKTRPISSTFTNFFNNFNNKSHRGEILNINLDDDLNNNNNNTTTNNNTTNNFAPRQKKSKANESFESLKFSLNSNSRDLRGKSSTKLTPRNEIILKPVIKKKDPALDINMFRQNVEDKLKTDLTKSIDKPINSNTFKLGKLNIERGRFANNLGKEGNLKSPLKIHFDTVRLFDNVEQAT